MCHVLIIENDWLLADHVAQLVERAGATSIDLAGAEDEAVAMAIARPPSVIVSDVLLTAGTGPAAVGRIAARIGACPTMFVTGTPDLCAPRGAGALLLVKPVDDDRLVAAFRTLVPPS
ncbi:hypothetical protein ASE95_16740 [Sphingomonas sp. Leaf231]|uniref:response regulator n=1 Tax=Sphingomonas sp. Leaf231 TaxID=1736301 RepID=UPI0006F28C1D|nr:response regulator [Sphingomonas sp. Leaf231]KQN89819.1 hypothetical protein ASE95_16740 [Sphingomonas sp. Leaf231]